LSRDDRLNRLLETARSGKRTVIVGILNVTPDSFSDGGRFFDADSAVRRAHEIADEGADIIDIGGESTRPGAAPVPADEELQRVLPVVEAIANELSVPISVDTRKAVVAREACQRGAAMINDVSAMTADPEMVRVAAEMNAAVCLVHMRGTPETMQVELHYEDVVAEVRAYLEQRVDAAKSGGVAAADIVVDPGIGFGKKLEHNLELLRRLPALAELGFPVLVGTSRKAMLGALLDGASPDDRLEGTAATVALAIAGGAAMIRVHDVRFMARVARVADAVVRGLTA